MRSPKYRKRGPWAAVLVAVWAVTIFFCAVKATSELQLPWEVYAGIAGAVVVLAYVADWVCGYSPTLSTSLVTTALSVVPLGLFSGPAFAYSGLVLEKTWLLSVLVAAIWALIASKWLRDIPGEEPVMYLVAMAIVAYLVVGTMFYAGMGRGTITAGLAVLCVSGIAYLMAACTSAAAVAKSSPHYGVAEALTWWGGWPRTAWQRVRISFSPR